MFYEISLLKILGICLVVLGHSTLVFMPGRPFSSIIPSPFFMTLTDYIYIFHLALFFFASGFLFRHQIPRIQSDFIKKKVHRLVVPYFSIGLLYLVPIWLYVGNYSISDIFKGLILAKTPGHLWFVLALFNVFVFFYAVRNLLPRVNMWLILLVLYAAQSLASRFNLFQIGGGMHYAIYFYIGYLMYEYRERFFSVKYLIPLLAILHIITIGFVMNGFKLGILASIIAVLLFYALCRKMSMLLPSLPSTNMFKLLDKNYFLLYLFHEPLMFVFYFHFARVGLNPFVLVFLCLLCSIIPSMLFCAIVWRSRYLRFLTGVKG